jgi:hypothetical protein
MVLLTSIIGNWVRNNQGAECIYPPGIGDNAIMKRAALAIAVSLSCLAWAQQLPNKADSFRFAVIGDSGTGGRAQYQVGARLAQYQKTIDFKTVVMLGDNIYGGQTPNDFQSGLSCHTRR